ncbi:MAG: ATP-binding cassette domain-containing protein [Anaerolineales bacterium]|nr:ATP-binding cassette domain-containing protein [Anaerolineales bacterium]
MSEASRTNLAIEAKGLVKRFGDDILAVDGIDLAIESNTIYALLGPNGAGKTTTINMLTTLLEPSEGSAKVAGFDVVKQANDVRNSIGVTFQETTLDDELTGRQALDYHARLYGMSKDQRQAKISELLALVELEEAAKRTISTYSGGMKRRLELIRGLMTDPKVLFLDEPTLGLDPQSRARIGDYIVELKEKRGMSVLLTTHYMDEAEKLSDKVAIIDHGKLLAEGTPGELVDQMGADVITITGQGNHDDFTTKVNDLSCCETITTGNGVIQIGVDSGSRRLVEIITLANETGYSVEDISVAKPSLGDVFLKYTGRQFRD